MKFTHLHVHTGYSFLDGYGLPEQILDRVEELGHDAIAITDHGNVWAHIPMYLEAKKRGNKTKIIYGCEFYFVDDIGEKKRKKYHITVYAKNEVGLVNLHRLVTFSNFDGFYYKPAIDFAALIDNKEGLIVTAGCIGSGYLIEHIRNGDEQAVYNFMHEIRKEFAGNFYVEVTPYRKFNEEIQKVIKVANTWKIPIIMTADAHFPRIQDSEVQDDMLCIGLKTVKYNTNRIQIGDIFHLWSYDFIKPIAEEMFGTDHLTYLRNTEHLAARCSVERIESGQKKIDLPEGFTGEVEYFDHLIEKGIEHRKLYKGWDNEKAIQYAERIAYERDLIITKGFVNYFLMIADLTIWAKKRMLVGAARGSAAGSIICYLLRITEVDPIPFGLMFERFIDITRYDPPDIDIDFPDEKRKQVIEYLQNKYGAEYTSQLGTISKFKPKISIWDIRRIYNLPFEAGKELTSLIVNRSSGDARAADCLEDSFNQFETSREILKRYPQFNNAIKLEGQIRQSGIHAAAVIVSEKPLEQISAFSKGKDGEIILTAEKKSGEALGLLKIDILGLKQLMVLENILNMIGKDNEWLYNVPKDYQKVFKLLCDRKFQGIFQFEGDAVKIVSTQVRPDSFINICEISALARPGSLHCGGTTKYIEYRAYEKDFDYKNKKKPYYMHPMLKELCGDTYGIVVYQEQVLAIIKEMGKMGWQDANDLRRAMSKSKGVEFFNKYKDKFLKGAKENKVDMSIAEEIWDNVCTFGSWAFNKSHAVSYGLLSYWTAYLKVNYPKEFYVCTLQKETDDVNIKRLIREWIEMGGKYKILDVNKSQASFSIDGDVILGGFSNIKGIGVKQAEKIVSMRPFRSLSDYKYGVPKKVQQILTIFDCLPEFTSGQLSLFQTDVTAPIPAPKVASNLIPMELAPWADLYPIGDEFQNMFDKFKGTQFQFTKIKEINEHSNEVWMIVKIISLNLRDLFEAGKTMTQDTSKIKDKHLHEFVNMGIEDDTGIMMAGVDRYKFPKYRELIFEEGGVGSVIGLHGKKIPGFNKIKIDSLKLLKKGKK